MFGDCLGVRIEIFHLSQDIAGFHSQVTACKKYILFEPNNTGTKSVINKREGFHYFQKMKGLLL
jgi:hypothetical protein